MRAARRRLVIASNRGPIVYGRSDGQRTARRGGGGLVTALDGPRREPGRDVGGGRHLRRGRRRRRRARGPLRGDRPGRQPLPAAARAARAGRLRPLLQRVREPAAVVHPARALEPAVRARDERRDPGRVGVVPARQRGVRSGGGRRVRRRRRGARARLPAVPGAAHAARRRRPRAAVALHAHPVARPRRVARADGRHAHRPARGPARRRRDRLPHEPLGAGVPGHCRGVRGRGVRRPRAAARDAARGASPTCGRTRSRSTRTSSAALAAEDAVRRGRGPAGGRPARAAGAARGPHRPVQERRPRLPCVRPVPRPSPRVARQGADARATGPVQAGDTRLCGVRWSDPPCRARGE